MATITVPNNRLFAPGSAEFGLQGNVIVSTSTLNGQTQTVELPGARWVATWTFAGQPNASRSALEAMFASLRGQANRLSAGHPLRRVPRGTLRGSPTLNGAHSALASTLSITGSGTLLAGDMLGVGGQLVMVTADNPALSAVPITPPLRSAQTAGTSVVWDWPRTLWIPTQGVVRATWAPVASPGFSVELTEVFS